MPKALIIKNADFSANRVTTVTFADIPCTGISFSEDTITVTDTEPVEIEYTVTPVDTTDDVIWASSDDSVCSILNGVMTINGIGTCTITATCGDFSATADVTVSIAVVPDFAFFNMAHAAGYLIPSGSQNYRRITGFGSGAQASTYEIPCSSSAVPDSPYAIKIPRNTTHIKLSVTSLSPIYSDPDSSNIMFMQDVESGQTGFPNSIKYIDQSLFNGGAQPLEHTFPIPSGADAFTFTYRMRSEYTSEDNANTVAVGFGLKAEFIHDTTT